ncbi:MAG: DUF3631 domain-containing protein, partial [Methyloceanibacter sp.]
MLLFGEADTRPTDYLLAALHNLPESCWSDIKGKPLSDRGLASRLRLYEIKSKTVRFETSEKTLKG